MSDFNFQFSQKLILFCHFEFLVPTAAIDLIIHLGRLRDRSRKLLEICEVTGLRDGYVVTAPIFRFCEKGEKEGRIIGSWEQTGRLSSRDKLAMAGVDCPWG